MPSRWRRRRSGDRFERALDAMAAAWAGEPVAWEEDPRADGAASPSGRAGGGSASGERGGASDGAGVGEGGGDGRGSGGPARPGGAARSAPGAGAPSADLDRGVRAAGAGAGGPARASLLRLPDRVDGGARPELRPLPRGVGGDRGAGGDRRDADHADHVYQPGPGPASRRPGAARRAGRLARAFAGRRDPPWGRRPAGRLGAGRGAGSGARSDRGLPRAVRDDPPRRVPHPPAGPRAGRLRALLSSTSPPFANRSAASREAGTGIGGGIRGGSAGVFRPQCSPSPGDSFVGPARQVV